MSFSKLIATVALCALLLGGCNKKSSTTIVNSKHVRIGYIGLTCEAPIYTAYEKGFFKEEGLEPELVKCNWANYKDTLALGGYNITHHLIMYFLKPIEQGLDVRFLAGIHRGCLRVQAGVKTNIHTIEDLKGKRIGVPGMGTPPFVFANRVFGTHGVDAGKDISWKVFPAGELGLAIDKGEVDAVADAEPIGTLLIAQGKVRNIADQIMDAPYNSEYCCEVIANGKWVDANPKSAAAATRALLKGAKWVETNPKAAAEMAVEKKYLASTPELNTVALSRLRYIPSVRLAEESLHTASREMKVAKMLSPETDTEALAKRAFMHLDGITDEWIKSLEVEKVAGGQVTPGEDIRLYAELIEKDTEDSCCRRKMFDQPDQDAPNQADPDAPCLQKKMIAAQK
ncbi:MAG: myristoyl transferase [Verrucomicrobia bacterium]|nr:MAG: myristoyl transferase [Verrucomicrobiota bacterium]PYL58472.1 MAG: myristoyl transferase [Verrucomicrobiota bacterium]